MKNCSNFKNRLHLLWVSWKSRTTALWKKCRRWIPLALVILVLAVIRIIGYAMPSWSWPFIGPLLYIRLLYDALLDILLIAAAVLSAMMLPGDDHPGKLRRFLLRPLLCAVLVMVLGISGTAAAEWAEEAAYNAKIDRQTRQIQEFIEIADEAVWYSTNQHLGDSDLEAFPEILRQGTHMEDFEVATHPYATNTMLIDYDSMTIAFCYHDTNYFRLRSFQLVKQDDIPENALWSHSVTLIEPGGQLTCYFAYRDDQPGNGSNMLCVALTMADGTVYTAADITDPKTGYNYYVGHLDGGEYQRIEDFLERKDD